MKKIFLLITLLFTNLVHSSEITPKGIGEIPIKLSYPAIEIEEFADWGDAGEASKGTRSFRISKDHKEISNFHTSVLTLPAWDQERIHKTLKELKDYRNSFQLHLDHNADYQIKAVQLLTNQTINSIQINITPHFRIQSYEPNLVFNFEISFLNYGDTVASLKLYREFTDNYFLKDGKGVSPKVDYKRLKELATNRPIADVVHGVFNELIFTVLEGHSIKSLPQGLSLDELQDFLKRPKCESLLDLLNALSTPL